MPSTPIVGANLRVVGLAAQPAVHRAFQWLHLHELRMRQWQRELVAIPAPPFREGARAAWFTDRFREMDLHAVEIDGAGNALGWLRAPTPGEPAVLLSAHLDTVFPAGTPIDPVEEDLVLRAPGAADNGAGLTALLALIAALRHGGLQTETNILFAANTGEEAEGNLRGMRHLFQQASMRFVGSLALEGAGTETVVTRGLGSRRFRVEVTGPGGHAWTDAGTPNPIVALADAIATLGRQRLPLRPRTVINIGRIEGGTSLTSIPQSAWALVDLRSVDGDELLRREVAIYRAVEDAVLAHNAARIGAPADGSKGLRFRIDVVGDRPAGELPKHAPVLQTVRAVDRHLRLRTEERIGSTDANIPIALGVNGVALGAGGVAGGIHTTGEWYDSTGRELALRRILLVLLDMTSTQFAAAAGMGRVTVGSDTSVD